MPAAVTAAAPAWCRPALHGCLTSGCPTCLPHISTSSRPSWPRPMQPLGDTETFSLKEGARPPSEAELRKKLTPGGLGGCIGQASLPPVVPGYPLVPAVHDEHSSLPRLHGRRLQRARCTFQA